MPWAGARSCSVVSNSTIPFANIRQESILELVQLAVFFVNLV